MGQPVDSLDDLEVYSPVVLEVLEGILIVEFDRDVAGVTAGVFGLIKGGAEVKVRDVKADEFCIFL